MKIWQIAAIVIGIIIGIIILASIATVNSNFQAESNENKLRIAYFPNIGHAIPIVGMEKGFFEQSLGDKVKIETRIFDSGPQVIETLISNSVDLAYVGPGPAINGYLVSENHNIKILSGAASGGASFIVHPNSQINSISDFANKKIAAPQLGNSQDVSLRHLLSENNLRTADKGGNVIVYNIANPDIYTLFVKGDIDGAWVAEPWATIFEKEFGGKRLFHEEELWPNHEFASVLLIGNIDYVKKNPELVSKFLESHKKVSEWINENPKETRIVFNDFLDRHLGKSIPDEIVDTALSNLKITTDPIKDSIYIFAKNADSLGYLGRNGYDLSEIFYYDSNNLTERDI
jgi:NitT/TauT family transport system substrate-binding protein